MRSQSQETIAFNHGVSQSFFTEGHRALCVTLCITSVYTVVKRGTLLQLPNAIPLIRRIRFKEYFTLKMFFPFSERSANLEPETLNPELQNAVIRFRAIDARISSSSPFGIAPISFCVYAVFGLL